MTAATRVQRTTAREDYVTILVSLWMIIGLLVDAFKHSTDPELETFWTPWHALFYSGFLVTAAWLLLVTYRRRAPKGTFLDWAPLGHRAALIGIGVFAAGGIGDAVWHEAFGVETSLDALLSPTHLLLFIGMLLIVSTPFRAAWLDPAGEDRPGFRTFVPALASLTFATALVAFFFEYAFVLALDWVPRQAYAPSGNGEFWAAFGVLGILVSTMILMPPVLLMMRRWRIPFGSVTVLLVLVNVFIAVAFDEDMSGVLPTIAAGLLADTLVFTNTDRRIVAFVVPVVLWGTYFATVGRIEQGLLWPPEIWGGAIFFAGLAGLGLQLGLDTASLPSSDAGLVVNPPVRRS